MSQLITFLKNLFEQPLFGVCSSLADHFNIPARYIRFNFVYISLITFGSPILLYLILGFWINLKSLVNKRRNTIWDL